METEKTYYSTQTGRNYGIDFLKIFSMYLVITLHIMGHTGILDSVSGISRYVAWFVEVIAYCAVDIYALISGYVGSSSNTNLWHSEKIIKLWSGVFFYSFGITLLFLIIDPKLVDIKDIIQSLFPVASNRYWYFSSYFPILLFKPFFNKAIQSLNRIQLTKMVVMIFVLFSVYQTFSVMIGADAFSLRTGYSMLWLISLYFIGSWLRTVHFRKIKNKIIFIIIALLCVITWILLIFTPESLKLGSFLTYTSPTVVLIAILMVKLFANIKIDPIINKCVVFFAPASFGVYLIHDHFLVREVIIKNMFTSVSISSPLSMLFTVVVSALLILFVCLFVEKLRLFLFKFSFDKIAVSLGKMVDKYLNSFINIDFS